MGINTIDVVSDNLSAWGVRVQDYTYNGTGCDFQDLLIRVSELRAATVEREITPMSTRMTSRNKKLDQLGAALTIIADIQAKYGEGNDSKDSTMNLTADAYAGLKIVGLELGSVGTPLKGISKSTAEYAQQAIKTKIDSLNNAGSKDMTRLQSLVDKRDEAYQTATSLMQSVSDTRSNTIKNM